MSEAAFDESSAEAEWAALEALHAEQQRLRSPAPKPDSTSPPTDPMQRALWTAIPLRGAVEYWRLVRMFEESHGLMRAQAALLDLVLSGRCYVAANHNGTTSVVGRGVDPRIGAHAYRTGAMG